LPSPSKNLPQSRKLSGKLVNKLARPDPVKERPAANNSSYAIAAAPASVGKETVNLKTNFQFKNNYK